jgi:hypothetical protein
MNAQHTSLTSVTDKFKMTDKILNDQADSNGFGFAETPPRRALIYAQITASIVLQDRIIRIGL